MRRPLGDVRANPRAREFLADLMREHHLRAIEKGYGDREWAAVGNYIAEQAGL